MSANTSEEEVFPGLVRSVKDYKNIIAVLQKEVNELKEKQLNLKKQANESEKLLTVDEKEDDDSLTAADKLSLHRARRLQAEALVMIDTQPIVDPQDRGVCDLMIDQTYDNVLENILQFTETMKKRKEELTTNIETLNVNIERDRSIAEGLQKKIDDIQLERVKRKEAEDEEEDEQVKVIEDQIKRTHTAYQRISEQLTDFLAEHFPEPNVMDDLEDTPNSSQASSNNRDYVSLGNLLEGVIRAYVNRPHDCYVEMNPNWWPRHVEMLLRYEILVPHPQFPNKVRLEHYDS